LFSVFSDDEGIKRIPNILQIVKIQQKFLIIPN